MIGIILVTYRFYPQRLFESIMGGRHQVRWYIFFHGSDPHIQQELNHFSNKANAVFFPFGINRGLARSWNEGLDLSLREGNSITLIVNDDLFFYNGAFDEYVDFIGLEQQRVPNFGLISVVGLDTGSDGYIGAGANIGQPTWQGLACAAVGPEAVKRIGYFDQNFWPVYHTDTDYLRRLEVANLPKLTDTRTLVEHDRSLTTRSDPELLRLHAERWLRGERYYLRKWGGLPGEEKFVNPFDNARFDYRIPLDRREAPYGPGYDRSDLAQAGTLGRMEGEE